MLAGKSTTKMMFNMFLDIADNKWITKLLYFILALLFVYLAYLIGCRVFNPYLTEFREGHSFSSTYLMLHGIKPFTIETFPEYYNSYGILYNIVCLPFAWIFGNTLVLHRIINQIFILATIVVLALYKVKYKFNILHVLVFIIAWSLMNYGEGVSVRPDGLGRFLFTVSIVIPFRYDYNKKSLCISILCALLAFYTKVYYVLGWYLVSVVLLLKNFRTCIVYNVLFHLILVISAIIICHILPLYFYETFFAYSTSVGNSGNGDCIRSLSYSIGQMKQFVLFCMPIVFVVISCSFNHVRCNWSIVLMSLLCIMVLLYPLGTNDGAFVTYHTQLLLPLVLVYIFNSQCCEKGRNIVVIMSLFFILHYHSCLFGTPPQKYQGYNQWKKIENLIDNNDCVMNSAYFSYMMMKKDKPLVDDGVSGFVFEYQPSIITTKIFGMDQRILTRKDNYINNIKHNIVFQKYDIILLTTWDRKFRDMVSNSTYILKEKFPMQINGICAEVFVYKPQCNP